MRLACWINDNVPSLGRRVVVTPNLSNRVDTPRVAASLAKGAARQNERGYGDAWTWSSGPVVAAWPTERTLQRCVPMAIDQTLIVLDWNSRPPFDGWAAATGAYNAGTDGSTPILDRALHDEFVGMLQWDRELVGSARTGRDGRAAALRRHAAVVRTHVRKMSEVHFRLDVVRIRDEVDDEMRLLAAVRRSIRKRGG